MRLFIIRAVLLISSCKAVDFSCQLWNEDKKSLEFYCDDFISVIPESCSNEVVSTQSSEVNKLKIGGCDGYIVSRTIRRFPNVRAIDISYSGCESLDWLDLNVDHLEQFNASHNKISNICGAVFSEMPNLIVLDLSHNKISTFDYDAFVNLTKLKYVDLSNNLIGEFHDLFRNHKNVEIHLENCPIERFSCPIFKANAVHISLKDIRAISTDCDEVEFRGVLNSGKEAVFPISNRKYEIHCSERSLDKVVLFTPGSNIAGVYDVIKCLGSSLEMLFLADYPLGKLNTSITNRFPNLEWLSLHNTSLSEFDFTMITHHPKLTNLFVSKNNLTHFNNVPLLKTFENLTALSLVEDQLDNGAEVIEHLPPSIEVLRVFAQRLGKPNATAFGKLLNIYLLELSNVSLVIFDSNPFEQLEKLRHLDISYNDEKNIDFAVLSTTLSKLTKLSAVHCYIQNISRLTQHLGASIETLDLSENAIGHLNAESFKTLSNVQRIYLSNASISSIDMDTFEHQSKLMHFDISNNKLKVLDFQLMPKSLEYFVADGNDLQAISNFNQQTSSQIHAIAIAQNQFSCDYLAKFMHDWPTLEFLSNPSKQKLGLDCEWNFKAHTNYIITVSY